MEEHSGLIGSTSSELKVFSQDKEEELMGFGDDEVRDEIHYGRKVLEWMEME